MSEGPHAQCMADDWVGEVGDAGGHRPRMSGGAPGRGVEVSSEERWAERKGTTSPGLSAAASGL